MRSKPVKSHQFDSTQPHSEATCLAWERDYTWISMGDRLSQSYTMLGLATACCVYWR